MCRIAVITPREGTGWQAIPNVEYPFMNRPALFAILTITACLACFTGLQAGEFVGESARNIPVAYEVDVVVVGGSSAGVTAAVEAANQGARVFLVAPRPYLGEDLCATYRLWLDESEEPVWPLAQRMFAEPAVPKVIQGLPFTYEADLDSNPTHRDTTPPKLLSNGNWDNAYKGSVQYDGDVTITVDLGQITALGQVHVMAYQRNNDIEVQQITVSASSDKTQWHEAVTLKNEKLGTGAYIDSALYLSAPVSGEARYLKFFAQKSPNVTRLLLGEIVVEPPEPAVEEIPRGPRIPPRPMQIKRELDQALLDAGVEFLYGSRVTDVLRDREGKLAGVVMANRSGRQAVRAKVIIDATSRATVARLAGAAFQPYPSGPQVFKRIVVGGELLKGEGLVGTQLPAPVVSARATYDAFEYTLTIPMADESYTSFAKADQIARDKTWHPGQIGASEVLFQTPPDAMRGKLHFTGAWPGANDMNLDALRPAKESGLYVLGGCADVPRNAAEALLRPLEYMALGMRVGQAAAAEAVVQPKRRVVCFGDSITAANFPSRLERLLDGVDIINAGVGGNTTAGGLARMEEDVLSHRPDTVIILFGTNDSVLTAPNKYKVPVAKYEANLREMVDRSKKAGAQVILGTLPPIQPEPYYTRHPKEFYDPQGGLEAILQRYRDASVRVAKSMDVPVADINALLKDDLSVLKDCGVHPSPRGEQRIAEQLAKMLPKILDLPKRTPDRRKVLVANTKGKTAVKGDVGEFLTGVRGVPTTRESIRSAQGVLPVLAKYDVVIVGGGTGGAPAGIGAARRGAKTLVIEYLHGLGGVSTLGLIGNYYHGYRGGFTAEMDQGVANMGGVPAKPKPSWNIEWKMEWYRGELREAGADIWFGALGCGAFVEGNVVKGVIVTTPEGRGVVLAKVVIDSTGNSDIAVSAGASCIYTDGSHVAVQGTGMPPRQPGAHYTNTDYTLTDNCDEVDRWRTFFAGRVKYQDSYDMGQVIDVRERRRIVGDFVISPLDIANGRTYPDSLVYSSSNFDTHGYTVHPLFALKPPDKKPYSPYTPYRCLLPKGLEGILVTGLGISAHRDAMPILRMQPDIQNQGYAAGMAAAMAAETNVGLRDIDLKTLQKHLVEKGNLPDNVLTDVDSYPYPAEQLAAAVRSASLDYDGLPIILAQPDEALPLLRSAYTAASRPAAKLIYAHILGTLGDPTGADTLRAHIAPLDWDAGWAFTGMGQFGASMSSLDSYIMALGLGGDKSGLQVILDKVEALGPASEFSHHRAVAVALEALRDKRAAKPLANLLRKPGMTGHAYTAIEDAAQGAQDTNVTHQRDISLRELILARALYRCGDDKSFGEEILRTYTRDLRGHHARHAVAVLKGK